MKKKNKTKNIKPVRAHKIKTPQHHLEKSKRVFAWLSTVVIITAACFFPMLNNDFTNWDDQYYVVNNAMLQGPDWSAIFTQPVAANYHPLTMASLAFNYQLSGLNPLSYLLFNFLLHLCNTALVFYFIYNISAKKTEVAFFTAVIFGIHPLHVESVAWISERKDVLYGLFFLLSLINYWRYLQARKRLNYGLSFLFFILSLLSKPAAVILPLVMILLDYWKGRPITVKTATDKIIFFLFALLFAIITLRIQTSVAAADLKIFPVWTRLFFASYGLMIYFIRFFIPYPLSSFHPFPSTNELGAAVYASPVFVLGLVALLWWQRKNKIIVFGFLFYTINLVLVLQIISVGLTIVSERYTYIPYIGLAFMFSSLLSQYKLFSQKKFSLMLPIAIVLIFGIITFKQVGVWKNSGTLWTNVIAHYPNSPYARTNRANFSIGLAQRPDKKAESDSLYSQALEDCTVALQLDPKHTLGYQNRINIFLILNRNREALSDAERIIKLDPRNEAGYLTKGIVYTRLNQADSALPNLNKTLAINPSSDLALNLRGTLMVNYYQKFPEALNDFNKAIGLVPKGDYYLNRSICYYRLGNIGQAKTDAQIAMQRGAVIVDSYRKLLNL
jgi:tetratricopeptide (TPR) repeat protein